MQQDVRQVPAHGTESKAPKVEDHPKNKRWPPIVADRLIAPLERPDVRRQGVPELRAILNQGVTDNLAQIVVYEFTAQRVDIDENAQHQRRQKPPKINPRAALLLLRLQFFTTATRAMSCWSLCLKFLAH